MTILCLVNMYFEVGLMRGGKWIERGEILISDRIVKSKMIQLWLLHRGYEYTKLNFQQRPPFLCTKLKLQQRRRHFLVH